MKGRRLRVHWRRLRCPNYHLLSRSPVAFRGHRTSALRGHQHWDRWYPTRRSRNPPWSGLLMIVLHGGQHQDQGHPTSHCFPNPAWSGHQTFALHGRLCQYRWNPTPDCSWNRAYQDLHDLRACGTKHLSRKHRWTSRLRHVSRNCLVPDWSGVLHPMSAVHLARCGATYGPLTKNSGRRVAVLQYWPVWLVLEKLQHWNGIRTRHG